MFVLPHTALKLREAGFPQGKTPYLWHLKKGAKVSMPEHGIVAGEEHWELYKRNKHDISAFGDSHGYNRWVSAPTIDMAQAWVKISEIERDLNYRVLNEMISNIAEILSIDLEDE